MATAIPWSWKTGTVRARRVSASPDRFCRVGEDGGVGEATSLYAYDLSRLGRSLVTVYRLAKRCGELGIPIGAPLGHLPTCRRRTAGSCCRSCRPSRSTSRSPPRTGRRRQRRSVASAATTSDTRRMAGVFKAGKLVANPTEDVSALIAAYERAGSISGACLILNAAGVRTRKGGPWRPATVAGVLDANNARQRRPQRGRPVTRTFSFSGLLQCACGGTLTGALKKNGRVLYECRRTRFDPNHPRPAAVSEQKLIPWAMAEANRDDPNRLRSRWQTTGRARPLWLSVVAALSNCIKMVFIIRDQRDRELRDIAAAVDLAERTSSQVVVPASIDWSWSTDDLNRVLRSLWRCLTLDEAMRPTRAEWLVPEWRA